MTVKTLIYPLFVLLSIFFHSIPSYSSDEVFDLEETTVDFIDLQNETFTSIASLLSEITGGPICSEEILGTDGNVVKKDFSMKSVSLKEALDHLVEIFPEYTWEMDTETNFINIFPKKNAPMDFLFKEFKVNDMSVPAIFYEDNAVYKLFWDTLEKNKMQAALDTYMNYWSVITKSKKTINLDLTNVTGRKLCNKLFSQLDTKYKYRWVVKPNDLPRMQRQKALMDVDYFLIFAPMRKPYYMDRRAEPKESTEASLQKRI